MENNKNNVIEEVTENVDTPTTEEGVKQIEQVENQSAETQSEKIYSEAEFQAKFEEAMNKKMPRREAKIRKEVDGKYSELVRVLQAGTGETDIDKITEAFKEHYSNRGVDLSIRQPEYSEKENAILARAEAEEIIASGFDEVIEETGRLANKGIENMSAREKEVFRVLAEHRENTERSKAISELGVSEEVYDSPEFKKFASMFKSDTQIKDIMSIYNKTAQPKKEIQTMGSLKNSKSDNSAVKDYYSPEEAKKFTRDDYNKTPGLLQAVENSMRRWKTNK